MLGKLNQVPDVIDARRLHGGKVKRYYLQSSLDISTRYTLRCLCVCMARLSGPRPKGPP
ncbi:GTP pyrophosphokinase [Salmonella enterica subsp. enterica]|uniref:GTP pyrophosphokinase n=1 Tax=Salmonella enterica I TaxID=59201 RepID=A0A447N4K7_SALET|nr:GTP pyrophosphokinase [Salmonella enterica subsp. enterica]